MQFKLFNATTMHNSTNIVNSTEETEANE